MEPTVYLNNAFLPASKALISPDDRGFVFADGVYEVVRYYGGRPLGMRQHLDRMIHSMREIQIKLPDDIEPFDRISDELISRNASPDAYVYWQVTRGPAPRDHRFPDPPVRPTVYACTKAMSPLQTQGPPPAMSAITHPEIRWSKCSIKSISLLPNVLARQAAHKADTDEAIFVRDDQVVTEATARSIFIAAEGRLHTYPLDGTVLGSITRQIAIDLANQLGIEVIEEPYALTQLLAADEVIAAGTTTEVRPITHVDGQPINNARIGPIARALADAYRRYVVEQCLR
jgi:D-alanine transaminase